ANGVKAFLKSTMIEETATTATFFCEKGEIRINSKFFMPSTVTIINGKRKEKVIDNFGYKTLGYNYEAIHFNQLLREGKKQSPIVSFDFSRKLISLLDRTREKIGLQYVL